MTRAVSGLALAAALSAPASGQLLGPVPVVDAPSILKIVQQIGQTEQLITMARTNLAQLPKSFSGTNIQSRLTAVAGLLQTAETACVNAKAGTAPSSACQVKYNVAITQASQSGQVIAELQSIKNAADGSTGSLQAQQAAAHAALAAATELQSMHQLHVAEVEQQHIDSQTVDKALHAPSGASPF